MKRREFLKLLSLISSGAVIASCKVDTGTDKLIPFLVPPEDGVVPGESVYYRSTCTECPAGCGIIVKVLDQFPIKLEGIPDHPINNGALCMRGQSSLMRLYHPDRLKEPLVRAQNGNL